MSDLRERVARAIHDVWRQINSAEDDNIADYAEWMDIEEWERRQILAEADAAIALIRAEVLEEAARVADERRLCSEWHNGQKEAANIAAAIRALEEKA